MAQQASGPNTGSFSGIDLDPVDWERRVADARARREVALARRSRASGPADRPGDTGPARAGKETAGAPRSYPAAPRAAIRSVAHAARLPSATGAFSAASGVLELAMPRRKARLAVLFGTGLSLGLAAAVALFLPDDDPAPLPSPAVIAADDPAEEAPDPAPGPSFAAITAPIPTQPEAAVEPVRLSLQDPAPAPESAEAAPAAAGEPTPVGPEAMTTAADARIFLHVPTGTPAATTDAVLAALAEAGLEVAGLVPARLEVGKSNLRYYHPEDAALASEIASALGASPVGAIEARDLAGLADGPAPGTLEIWLAGEAKPGPAPSLPVALETAEAPAARPLPRDGGIDPALIQNLVEAARAGSG